MDKTKHNYGLDLLRIISMLFIVSLHVLFHGGVLNSVNNTDTVRFSIVWLLEIFSYCGVNCFALISGFVGYRNEYERPKYSGTVMLWLQVVFYSLLLTVLFKIRYPGEIGAEQFTDSLFPISSSQYWYFTAYFGVAVFRPVFNKIIRAFNSREDILCSFLIFTAFSAYSTLAVIFGDPFGLRGGYSFLWLCALYFIGAQIKKHEIYKNIKPLKVLAITFALPLATWLIKTGLTFIEVHTAGAVGFKIREAFLGDILISYLSPTVFGASVGLVLFSANLKISERLQKVIGFFTSSVFGVYLLHDNILVRNFIIKDRFSFVVGLSPWKMTAVIAAAVVVIFMTGVFADKVRLFLFNLLRLKKLADFFDRQAYKAAEKTVCFIKRVLRPGHRNNG
jgi:surface polysaccharide O-acyltransferase-like enzyme